MQSRCPAHDSLLYYFRHSPASHHFNHPFFFFLRLSCTSFICRKEDSHDFRLHPPTGATLPRRSTAASIGRTLTLGSKRPFTRRPSLCTRPVKLKNPPVICVCSFSRTMPADHTGTPSTKSYRSSARCLSCS